MLQHVVVGQLSVVHTSVYRVYRVYSVYWDGGGGRGWKVVPPPIYIFKLLNPELVVLSKIYALFAASKFATNVAFCHSGTSGADPPHVLILVPLGGRLVFVRMPTHGAIMLGGGGGG